MLYENNEQVKEFIKSLMTEKGISYRKLGEAVGTSQQNIHKILNKNQLRFDDVYKICNALGYDFYIEISPKGKKYDVHKELERLTESEKRLYKILQDKTMQLDSLKMLLSDINTLTEKIEIEKK